MPSRSPRLSLLLKLRADYHAFLFSSWQKAGVVSLLHSDDRVGSLDQGAAAASMASDPKHILNALLLPTPAESKPRRVERERGSPRLRQRLRAWRKVMEKEVRRSEDEYTPVAFNAALEVGALMPLPYTRSLVMLRLATRQAARHGPIASPAQEWAAVFEAKIIDHLAQSQAMPTAWRAMNEEAAQARLMDFLHRFQSERHSANRNFMQRPPSVASFASSPPRSLGQTSPSVSPSHSFGFHRRSPSPPKPKPQTPGPRPATAKEPSGFSASQQSAAALLSALPVNGSAEGHHLRRQDIYFLLLYFTAVRLQAAGVEIDIPKHWNFTDALFVEFEEALLNMPWHSLVLTLRRLSFTNARNARQAKHGQTRPSPRQVNPLAQHGDAKPGEGNAAPGSAAAVAAAGQSGRWLAAVDAWKDSYAGLRKQVRTKLKQLFTVATNYSEAFVDLRDKYVRCKTVVQESLARGKANTTFAKCMFLLSCAYSGEHGGAKAFSRPSKDRNIPQVSGHGAAAYNAV